MILQYAIMGFLFFLFGLYQDPCSAHVGYKGTDRSLLTGHDALLLQQIARDLLHALSNRHGWILHWKV